MWTVAWYWLVPIGLLCATVGAVGMAVVCCGARADDAARWAAEADEKIRAARREEREQAALVCERRADWLYAHSNDLFLAVEATKCATAIRCHGASFVPRRPEQPTAPARVGAWRGDN